MNIKKIGIFLFSTLLFVSAQVSAAVYTLPAPDRSLIGQIQYTSIGAEETVTTLAERFNIGYNAIENANPQINFKRPFFIGMTVQIPTEHLLPNQPRQGIVINLPEMRMYYYPVDSNLVYTYPIGIGKIGKTIPITKTIITRKTKDPTWTPPQDIREFNLDQGIVLPKVMPPGPDNPLGPYAIYMRLPTYLIHSTIFPESVGRRASFGCIRMFRSDIEELFPTMQKGIPVAIINSPVKIGWEDNHLFIEAYQPLEEHDRAFDASLPGMVHTLLAVSNRHTLIDWQLVAYIANERDGIPHEIGIRLP